MIKIAQFGEGNFLRTFVDAYFDTLNKEKLGEYEVSIIKPISFGDLERFKKQNNKYHIVLRGQENGSAVENVFNIDVVKNAVDPFADRESYLNIATDKDLKIIVSNTTEAGICYHETDTREDFKNSTYPAKLTNFLFARFSEGLDGVYILPVELIEDNAVALKSCVDKYIELWNLPKEFKKWNDEKNFYCNTLVDRIVSGYPRDEETKKHINAIVGETDDLVSIGEPFGLWAIEKKGNIEEYIKEGKHNIDVVLTENIPYYKKRKVRVLNGSHTNLVPAGIALGKNTVYDCMIDEKLNKFFKDSLEEIIPFVSSDEKATRDFSADVEERFFNPYLNHQLWSIALNSVSKWVARDLPTFNDYYIKHGVIAPKMTIGFSYLIYLYQTQLEKVKDDSLIIEKFSSIKDVKSLVLDKEIWGVDLSAYDGFAEVVAENVQKLYKGEILL